MPNFMPCRTREDGDAHLYAAGEPDLALCGKVVEGASADPGSTPVCVECAQRLLTRVFRLMRSGAQVSVEVTVQE